MTRESPRILLVEDERTLREALADALAGDGFTVEQAADGVAGLTAFRAKEPDLVLLDLMLPEMNGIEICRAIRSNSKVPIIMVTAKAAETDRIAGLDLGADDYVTKPFSARELSARIRAVLRRGSTPQPPAKERTVRVGEAEVDLDGQRILLGHDYVRADDQHWRHRSRNVCNEGHPDLQARARHGHQAQVQEGSAA